MGEKGGGKRRERREKRRKFEEEGERRRKKVMMGSIQHGCGVYPFCIVFTLLSAEPGIGVKYK